MVQYLVTGANRGIGLALSQKILSEGHHLLAACRYPKAARDLWELEASYPGMCDIIQLDVTKDEIPQVLKPGNTPRPIDVLVNNAGILREYGEGIKELSLQVVDDVLQTNVLGCMRMVRWSLPALERSSNPIIANITSKVGSIADNGMGRSYAYRMSKTALNMFTKNLSIELKEMISVAIHPGWVQTDMGGNAAPTTPWDSADGIYNQISRLTRHDSGRFFDFRGDDIPW